MISISIARHDGAIHPLTLLQKHHIVVVSHHDHRSAGAFFNLSLLPSALGAPLSAAAHKWKIKQRALAPCYLLLLLVACCLLLLAPCYFLLLLLLLLLLDTSALAQRQPRSASHHGHTPSSRTPGQPIPDTLPNHGQPGPTHSRPITNTLPNDYRPMTDPSCLCDHRQNLGSAQHRASALVACYDYTPCLARPRAAQHGAQEDQDCEPEDHHTFFQSEGGRCQRGPGFLRTKNH